MVMGPLPPLFPSEVQTNVSAAGIPDPAQLQEDAGQLTARMLLAPVRLTLTGFAFAEVTLKLEGNDDVP
jgi:hypothetical protein